MRQAVETVYKIHLRKYVYFIIYNEIRMGCILIVEAFKCFAVCSKMLYYWKQSTSITSLIVMVAKPSVDERYF